VDGTEGHVSSVKRAEMGDPSACTSFLTNGGFIDGGLAEYMVRTQYKHVNDTPPRLNS